MIAYLAPGHLQPSWGRSPNVFSTFLGYCVASSAVLLLSNKPFPGSNVSLLATRFAVSSGGNSTSPGNLYNNVLWNHVIHLHTNFRFTWWHHQMETFSLHFFGGGGVWGCGVWWGWSVVWVCGGVNSPHKGQSVTGSFDVFFDLCLINWLSKQSRHKWFETPSRSLWLHCDTSFRLGWWHDCSSVNEINMKDTTIMLVSNQNKTQPEENGVHNAWDGM